MGELLWYVSSEGKTTITRIRSVSRVDLSDRIWPLVGAEWSIPWLLSSLKMEMSPPGSLRRSTWAVSGCGRGEIVSIGPLKVSDMC